MDALSQWISSTLQEIQATNFTTQTIDSKAVSDAIEKRQSQLSHINNSYSQLTIYSKEISTTVPLVVQHKISRLNSDWASLKDTVAAHIVTSNEEDITDLTADLMLKTSTSQTKSFTEEVLEAAMQSSSLSTTPPQRTELLSKSNTEALDSTSVTMTTTGESVGRSGGVQQAELDKFIAKLDGLSKMFCEKATYHSVTVADLDEIREAIYHEQTKLNELQGMKPHLDAIVVRTEVSKQDQFTNQQYRCILSESIERLCRDWETSTSIIPQRLSVLNTMLTDCVQFNEKISHLEKWVMSVLEACCRQDLGHDIATVEENIEEAKALQLEVIGQQTTFDAVHAKAQHLIDEYSKDDIRKVKADMKQMSRLWSELYNRLNDREKSLRSHLNALSRFDADLSDFILWLTRAQLVLSRKQELFLASNDSEEERAHVSEDLKQVCEALESEMESKRELIESVNMTGKHVVSSTASSDTKNVASKLNEMNERWEEVNNKYTTVRRLVEPDFVASKAISSTTIKDLLHWLNSLDQSLDRMKPIGGDLTQIRGQIDDHQVIRSELEDKEALVEQTMKDAGVEPDDSSDIPHGKQNNEAVQLKMKWKHVNQKSSTWQNTLD